jgi:hypothetical protein
VDWKFWVALGAFALLIVLAAFAVAWRNRPPDYKDVRIVRVNRSTGKKSSCGFWKPISHMSVVSDDIRDLREADDGTFAYSLEYRTYPDDAVQCDDCGGNGCVTCNDRGWLPSGHPSGRKCRLEDCGKPLSPAHFAVYCTNRCAHLDV